MINKVCNDCHTWR